MKNVLIIVAHPDDEVLGCGAAMCRHREEGHRVAALSLTDGVGARGTGPKTAKHRREAARQSSEVIGFEWLIHGDFPDNALDSVSFLEVVQFIESVKEDFVPDLVYTHHGGDLNIDHRITFRAVLTAFRPKPDERTTEIRTFEVVSSTEWSHSSIGAEFSPNLFIDISEYWDTKIKALDAYDLEMRAYPHSRSREALEALAKRRGTQVGLQLAEAFETVRHIVR